MQNTPSAGKTKKSWSGYGLLFFVAISFYVYVARPWESSPSPVIIPTKHTSENQITQANFGDKWPLTVSSGEIQCINQMVIFTVQGTIYAVNGTAKTHSNYKDIREIWADSPQGMGLKKDIGPLINYGLKLCK